MCPFAYYLLLPRTAFSSDHSPDSEQETWFENVNKALPEVNINI